MSPYEKLMMHQTRSKSARHLKDQSPVDRAGDFPAEVLLSDQKDLLLQLELALVSSLEQLCAQQFLLRMEPRLVLVWVYRHMVLAGRFSLV